MGRWLRGERAGRVLRLAGIAPAMRPLAAGPRRLSPEQIAHNRGIKSVSIRIYQYWRMVQGKEQGRRPWDESRGKPGLPKQAENVGRPSGGLPKWQVARADSVDQGQSTKRSSAAPPTPRTKRGQRNARLLRQPRDYTRLLIWPVSRLKLYSPSASYTRAVLI